ncbi:MAG: hypothetical protein ACPF8V_09235 [Luteibaculum sp.]
MRLLYTAILALIICSCYKPGKIEVVNNIDRVEIRDVKWGEIRVASSLFPGEKSKKLEIDKSTDRLPSTYNVSFVMSANGRSIFLTTEATYDLDQDETLTIILDDDTPVKSNN